MPSAKVIECDWKLLKPVVKYLRKSMWVHLVSVGIEIGSNNLASYST